MAPCTASSFDIGTIPQVGPAEQKTFVFVSQPKPELCRNTCFHRLRQAMSDNPRFLCKGLNLVVEGTHLCNLCIGCS